MISLAIIYNHANVHAINHVMLSPTHFIEAKNMVDAKPFTIKELFSIFCKSQDMTNKKIAAHLFLGRVTVKNYNAAVYAKLNVKQCPQAITRLKKMGLI